MSRAAKLTPTLQVNESVLKKVIEWCTHHKGDPPSTGDDDSDSRKKTTDIDEWDQKFMQVDQEMLFEIILVWLSFTVLCHSPHAPFQIYAVFRFSLCSHYH